MTVEAVAMQMTLNSKDLLDLHEVAPIVSIKMDAVVDQLASTLPLELYL